MNEIWLLTRESDYNVAIEIFNCARSFPLSHMVIVENRMTKHSRDSDLKSELRRMGGGGWHKMSHVG